MHINSSKEEQEAKRKIILEQYADISDHDLICLSLAIERKMTKVTELETVIATKEQQEK
jgi:hypothetical protein